MRATERSRVREDARGLKLATAFNAFVCLASRVREDARGLKHSPDDSPEAAAWVARPRGRARIETLFCYVYIVRFGSRVREDARGLKRSRRGRGCR